MNVALAAAYDTDAVLTLDRRDFRPFARWAGTRHSGCCRLAGLREVVPWLKQRHGECKPPVGPGVGISVLVGR